jgi:hypothetical protein
MVSNYPKEIVINGVVFNQDSEKDYRYISNISTINFELDRYLNSLLLFDNDLFIIGMVSFSYGAEKAFVYLYSYPVSVKEGLAHRVQKAKENLAVCADCLEELGLEYLSERVKNLVV